MKTQYKTVDVTTLKGLKEAERLHQSGWKVIRPGMFSLMFERKESPTALRARRAKGEESES